MTNQSFGAEWTFNVLFGITETSHVIDMVMENNVVDHEVYEVECPRCHEILKDWFHDGINVHIQ